MKASMVVCHWLHSCPQLCWFRLFVPRASGARRARRGPLTKKVHESQRAKEVSASSSMAAFRGGGVRFGRAAAARHGDDERGRGQEDGVEKEASLRDQPGGFFKFGPPPQKCVCVCVCVCVRPSVYTSVGRLPNVPLPCIGPSRAALSCLIEVFIGHLDRASLAEDLLRISSPVTSLPCHPLLPSRGAAAPPHHLARVPDGDPPVSSRSRRQVSSRSPVAARCGCCPERGAGRRPRSAVAGLSTARRRARAREQKCVSWLWWWWCV